MFGGDPASLKGKLIGGLFHIEQTEYNGNIYDHTRMRYTRVADAVREGKYGKLPADKLVSPSVSSQAPLGDPTDFMAVPDDGKEEVPW